MYMLASGCDPERRGVPYDGLPTGEAPRLPAREPCGLVPREPCGLLSPGRKKKGIIIE